MVQIQPKQIANSEIHYVGAELTDSVITYSLFNIEQVEVGSGTLSTDGSVTEENLIEVVLSSLGASVKEVS